MAEGRGINDKLDSLEKGIDEIRLQLTSFLEQAKTRQRDLSEIRTTVYGNGTPGLKAEVQRIGERCEERCKAPGFWRQVGINVLSSGILVVAGAVLILWATHFKGP